MGEYKDYRPEWLKQLGEKIKLKMDSLEQYEEKSYEVELNDFYDFLDGCQSVWTVAYSDLQYGDDRLINRKFFSTAGLLDVSLSNGIKKRGLSPEEVPLIPMVEYKLVPTGNIEYYDATLTKNQRRNKRYWRGEAGSAKLCQQREEGRKKC